MLRRNTPFLKKSASLGIEESRAESIASTAPKYIWHSI
jgi:hypothetical protein